ncbi:Rho GTPase activation protein [Pseudovirgaria hyperparasitica]|uniref:Rho GTPase activation protein n=1 Tax=Pseudovirgaria hyperparasitica TaxID=470096 RepID=A0A6A6VUP7_9PEZI|nr:Rho GTPase activation protein [Pseudovirgaria hyperparasitica]KAF2753516.1 Rho GTPase activation protein [Pseudovirgaria hyperparasitica]
MDQSRQASRRKNVSEAYTTQASLPEGRVLPSRSHVAPTIRAVTPEPELGERSIYSRDGSMVNSPPISPRSGSNQESPRNTTPRAYGARGNANEGDVSLRGAKESQLRPRTRTMEERTARDVSSSNLFVTSRHRVGSVHAAASGSYQGSADDIITSIGHPSIDDPATASSSMYHTGHRSTNANRNRLIKFPPQQPMLLPHSSSTTHPDSWAAPTTTSDTRKILRLMKTSSGKMQGMLAFRRGASSNWSMSYCYINDESGSLVFEPRGESSSYHRTLIPDLRGCKVRSGYDAESVTSYIEVALHNSSLEVHLRPPTQDAYDSWFAALLCWQPLRPKGILNRMAKPQAALATERRLVDSRRHSEVSLLKEAPIIKVGKMIYWDTSSSSSSSSTTRPETPKSSRPGNTRMQSQGARKWRKVSCTLRENGELKLYADTDVTLVSVVQLSHLSRSAIQRLNPSVLDNEFCIAIYPQYTSAANSLSLLRPVVLSLESRVLYEVWIVLLRAFTIPQLYGPKQSPNGDMPSPGLSSSTVDMFRMERSLSMRIMEAKLTSSTPAVPSTKGQNGAVLQGGYYIEVLLDNEIRARSTVIAESSHPFWGEDFEFTDLPAVMSSCTIVLKRRPAGAGPIEPSRKEVARKAAEDALTSTESFGIYNTLSFDQTVGKVDIYLDDLESNKPIDKWWQLNNMYANPVGEVMLKVSTDDSVILMARDYQPMSELLHKFSNGLTLQLAQMIPNELKRLSDYLLNIFQVSGQAGDWIMALVEEEIDGTQKETPASRLRFSRRMGSTDSSESVALNSDRELLVRDMGNNAKLEANLLFRGNTLLTKSLDLHMRRLGKEYLEETLSDKMNEILEKDPDCEVDPNKVLSSHDLDKNWRKLISWTEEVWKAIFNSANRCPQELRIIFRHIRGCAEDRFGDFLRTVAYSSVSGFLFLRFFCPAVLNPNLFGLLKDKPKMRARRTYTLIAKSLQGLANMSTFGSKEHWMEPMNSFLTAHRQEFRTFLDTVCSVPSGSGNGPPIPPSYSTPIAILQRLPPTSREGFPSLPYLIDHARNFAGLVTLWLEHANTAHHIQEGDGDLAKFHAQCQSLKQRTKDCLAGAERAERPSSSLSVQWEELVEQLETSAVLDLSRRPGRREVMAAQSQIDDDETSPTSTPVTMKHAKPRTFSGSGAKPSSIISSKALSSRYAPSSGAASASASAAGDTPPGSSHGWEESMSRGTIGRSHVDPSLGDSDDEYATALPKFSSSSQAPEKDKAKGDKEKSGFKNIVPSFSRKKK